MALIIPHVADAITAVTSNGNPSDGDEEGGWGMLPKTVG